MVGTLGKAVVGNLVVVHSLRVARFGSHMDCTRLALSEAEGKLDKQGPLAVQGMALLVLKNKK